MDYTKTAKDILNFVGGEENVNAVTHCMTRLRLNLHDQTKVERGNLERIPGVMGTIISGDQLQVVLGNEVSSVYKVIQDMLIR